MPQLKKKAKDKSGLADKLKGVEIPTHEVPFWKGPEEDGVTQSMLQRFLNCRERFRLKYIEGLTPPDDFHHRLEYGSMWHVCEEHVGGSWKKELLKYVAELNTRYPLKREAIAKWCNVCMVQFPQYVDYWKKKTKKKVEWVEREISFDVLYTLPSGRVVRLRGKRDGVLQKYNPKRRVLRENKTKGDIEEQDLIEQLGFDLQTMLYTVAHNTEHPDKPVYEVEYNVVRRPLSGGKGNIRQLQNANKGKKGTDGKPLSPREETLPEYYARLGEYIKDDPSYFFMRWDVTLTEQDIRVFTQQFLEPVLEQLYDWWDWMNWPLEEGETHFSHPNGLHWRHPYGVYNVLDRGGTSEYDEYLQTGSEVGLVRGLPLFPEL